MTGLSWSCLRTTSRADGSSTATSRSHDPENLTHEGQAERQEDLRQVQGDPPPRPGHGHLRQPAPQAAPGLTHAGRRPAPLAVIFARRIAIRIYTVTRSRSVGDDTPGRRPGTRPVRPGKVLWKTSDNHLEPDSWHALQALISRAKS